MILDEVKDKDKLESEIVSRYDEIDENLREMKEKEVERKAKEFKEEALGVLKTHIEREKQALVPELDVFTGRPMGGPEYLPSSPMIKITDVEQPEMSDLIDLTTPKSTPIKQTKRPDRLEIFGDLLAFEGPKTPILEPRRRLDFDETIKPNDDDLINLLDTTPPALITARSPLEPQKREWWDVAANADEVVTTPLRPTAFQTTGQVKSFMETASDWIRHAQVQLTQQETKAGYDLWSDILAAPSGTEPIEEPVMPDDWDSKEEVVEDDLLVGFE